MFEKPKMQGLTALTSPVDVNGDSSARVQAAIVKAFFDDPNIPEERKEKVRRQHKARNNLMEFVTYTKSDYMVNWHHEIICAEIDDFLKSETRNRLMVFVGPRRGKSEIISRRLPAYAMGKNPNLNVIACSYSSELAKSMSRDTQRIIDSKEYAELFPRTRLNGKNVKTSSMGKSTAIRTTDKFEIVGYEGKYRAAGVGVGITGQGADLAIIDDPIKDWKEALSKKRKQDVYDWYTSTFYTRLSKNGKVIILMTRWSDDDLCGKLLAEAAKNPDADQWEVISFPEEYDEENEYAHPLDPREQGDILWPEMFDRKKVNLIKATAGTKVWTSLFQQQPKPGDGTAFKTSWFKYFDVAPQFDRIVTSWDFNFGSNTETADYVVGTVWGIKGANKYLIYMVREKLTFTQSLSEMQRVHQMYPQASYTVIEGKANGPAITDVVKDKIPGVVVFMPSSSKIARALAASATVEAGNIMLPNMYVKANRELFSWALKLLTPYIEEFKAFPFVDNDDMVDSTVQMILRELETPTWLISADAQSSEKTKEEVTREQVVANMFGWGDQLGTSYNPEDGTGAQFKLGF